MTNVKIVVGGSLAEDGKAFVEAWRRAERGEQVPERTLAFESWEALASVLSKERLRLLRHVHRHPERSVAALAQALGRQYRRVHEDVALLSEVGLLERDEHGLHANADRIETTIEL